jgi:dihydroorotate dehydrogenase (NAD+) catalytic subunit
VSAGRSALQVQASGLTFQNPIVLAAGTAAYGHELSGVVDLAALGGLVTKAVSPEPREGAPSPRVAEFGGGMINAIGLANPGVAAVRAEHLPWLARELPSVRKLANIVGFAVEEFAAVIEQLELSLAAEAQGALDGFELNVSCPNVKAGGMEFGADPESLRQVVSRARAVTRRPLFVKLSPTLPEIARTAQIAVDAGADGLTLVNTIPGLVIDVERRRPALGFGTGGVSGTALLPVGVLATAKVRRVVKAPIVGIGGVSTAEDALQYLIAGATLVGVGTAMLRDPRTPERIVGGLARWCDRHGVSHISEIVGSLEALG